DDSDDDTESNEESEVGFVLILDSESTFTEDRDVDTRELTVEDVSMPYWNWNISTAFYKH
ncbi:hypothetical protein ACJMK2_021491, partial [Sinanodonta woodiana]